MQRAGPVHGRTAATGEGAAPLQARGVAGPAEAPLRATAQLLGRSPRVSQLLAVGGTVNRGFRPAAQHQPVVGGGVVQAMFRQVGTAKWVDEDGNRYVQAQVRVDNEVAIKPVDGGTMFTIVYKGGQWDRKFPAHVRTPSVPPKDRPGRFFKGARGTVLTRSPSFDSDDSEGEEYHVSGDAEHAALAERGKKAPRATKTQNLVSAALTVVYRKRDGSVKQVSQEIKSMWNSGYFQRLLADEAAPKVSFEKGQRDVASRVLPEKKFTAQLHAHSEVAMDADPKVVKAILAAFTRLAGRAGPGGVILKVVIRAHSSPNTVCMNACRGALEEVRAKIAGELAVDAPDIRPSGRFAVELMVTSDRPFQKLAGNKPHATLAAGKGGEDAGPRLEGGRVIEVLNDQDRAAAKPLSSTSDATMKGTD